MPGVPRLADMTEDSVLDLLNGIAEKLGPLTHPALDKLGVVYEDVTYITGAKVAPVRRLLFMADRATERVRKREMDVCFLEINASPGPPEARGAGPCQPHPRPRGRRSAHDLVRLELGGLSCLVMAFGTL